MAAYHNLPARPVLLAADTAAIQAIDVAQLSNGQCVLFTGPGANFRKLASWDPSSVAAHDGLNVWRPTAILVGDPGRFLVIGTVDAQPFTYVQRDGLGNMPAQSGNFPQQVLRVNYAEGVNDPVPSALCGLSVDRGSSGGVERARAALLYDEASGAWYANLSTTNDTVIGGGLPFVAGEFRTPGGGSSGVVRIREDEVITANIGGVTYDLAKGTNAGVAHFGSATFPSSRLESAGDVLVRSVSNDIELRARELQLFDAAGANQLVSALTGGSFFKVLGRFAAHTAANAQVFDVDVANAVTRANGTLRGYNAAGSTLAMELDTVSLLFSLFTRLAVRNGKSRLFVQTDAPSQTVGAVQVTGWSRLLDASDHLVVLAIATGANANPSTSHTGFGSFQSADRPTAGSTQVTGVAGGNNVTVVNSWPGTDPSWTWDASANALRLLITGIAGETINWSVTAIGVHYVAAA